MNDDTAAGAGGVGEADVAHSTNLIRRLAVPADYDRIIEVLDDWFERPMTSKLPRLFLDHFCNTSTAVDSADGEHLNAFLVGSLSPAQPAGIHPFRRRPSHPARQTARAKLYEDFVTLAGAAGRHIVRAVTAPDNVISIAFHEALGFDVVMPPGTTISR